MSSLLETLADLGWPPGVGDKIINLLEQFVAYGTTQSQTNARSRDKLTDAVLCIITYGEPDPTDQFEVDLAAEMPSSNLPLWAAQIKCGRQEDGDWTEGGLRHKRMIVQLLYRYHRIEEAAKRRMSGHEEVDDDDSCLSSLVIPAAVFRILPLWLVMFLGDAYRGQGRYDSAQYKPQVDPAEACQALVDSVPAFRQRLANRGDSLLSLKLPDLLGIILVIRLARCYSFFTQGQGYEERQMASTSRLTLDICMPDEMQAGSSGRHHQEDIEQPNPPATYKDTGKGKQKATNIGKSLAESNTGHVSISIDATASSCFYRDLEEEAEEDHMEILDRVQCGYCECSSCMESMSDDLDFVQSCFFDQELQEDLVRITKGLDLVDKLDYTLQSLPEEVSMQLMEMAGTMTIEDFESSKSGKM